MKLKAKTWYSIVFYAFVVFTFVCYVYTIVHFIKWIIGLF